MKRIIKSIIKRNVMQRNRIKRELEILEKAKVIKNITKEK